MPVWNPWHGCLKYSEGCQNCYVFRRDDSIGKDASVITKTANFDLPQRRDRQKNYKLFPGSQVYTCMTSDFFIEAADEWRSAAWNNIRMRKDLHFYIFTKRIIRFMDCIPPDWGDGWEHVSIGCTIENQKQCDIRFPVFLRVPIKNRFVTCEPLLGPVNLRSFLCPEVQSVIVGGESGNNARICDYAWVLDIREQCLAKNVRFVFKQTGANFRKDGRIYSIPRQLQEAQAKKAGIDAG